MFINQPFWYLLFLCYIEIAELKLKKVLILSRHNVRTPLSKTLSQTSPREWPHWDQKPGFLTPKGILLEGYMGIYFYQWLKKEDLLSETCPTEDRFFVYANTAQRTMVSARSFVKKAYPHCRIRIHHANFTDPIFNPVIHNNSSTFLKEALNIMQNEIQNLHLNNSLQIMEDLLDYSHSENCIKHDLCNLVDDSNNASLKTGSKPNINGPLKITKSAIDSFIMENYEGFETKKVAWGLLNTDQKWKNILDLSKNYHSIIFNNTIVAKDISRPLLKYMSDILLADVPKVTLLMGHDANMYTVLNAMNFKWFELRDQYEITPIGGKIVFQKWSSNSTDFLKIDYVYQSTEQMRNGTSISLVNPPLFENLELEGCNVDQNGYCLWSDFEKILKKLSL